MIKNKVFLKYLFIYYYFFKHVNSNFNIFLNHSNKKLQILDKTQKCVQLLDTTYFNKDGYLFI